MARTYLEQTSLIPGVGLWQWLLVWVGITLAYTITGQTITAPASPVEKSILDSLYVNPQWAVNAAHHMDSMARLRADTLTLAKALNYQGMGSNLLGNTELSLARFLESLRLFEIQALEWDIARLYNNIGAAYNLRQDPERTIYYYEKALTGFRELNDSLWIGKVLYNLSTQQNALGNYQEDLALKKEAIAIMEQIQDSQMLFFFIPNLGHTLFTLNRYEEALIETERFLRSPYATQNPSLRSNTLLTHAFALEKLGRINEALAASKEALQIAQINSLQERAMKAHGHLAVLYELTNQPALALSHHKAYHETYKNYFNEDKEQRVEKLLATYETEKKEAAIKLLEAEKTVNQLELRQASRVRKGLLWGIFATAIIGIFLARLQWLRTQANRELASKNKQLNVALQEKNVLLREIHHRVKNNLQVISSLLKLQSHYIEDPLAVRAIAEGRNRVHTMALLHQSLYKEDNLSGVNMQAYFGNLIESLFDTYNVHPDTITLHTEIQPLVLDIDTVIPLGLITNELISNALKHAFEDIQGATLTVKLWEEGNALLLQVTDNGKGYDPVRTMEENKSFGQKLVRTLAERIQAEIEVISDKGTAVLLRIKDYQIAH